MRIIILLLGVQFASVQMAFTQSYTLTPGDTFKMSGTMEDLETLTISQLNNSTGTIILKWKKISESLPANWEAVVCDNQFCYASLTDSGTMNPVLPSETGFLLLHITAHVNYGTSVIRYAVWDADFPVKKDTLTFILTVNNTLSKGEVDDKQAFRVFPNPAQNFINIRTDLDEGFHYSFIDLSGKVISTGISKASSTHILFGHIPNGVYRVSIRDNTGNIITKTIIIQQ